MLNQLVGAEKAADDKECIDQERPVEEVKVSDVYSVLKNRKY